MLRKHERKKKQNGATFSVGQPEMAITISPPLFFFFFVDTSPSTSIDIELSKLKRIIFPNPKYELNMCVFRLFQVPWHLSYHPERKHQRHHQNSHTRPHWRRHQLAPFSGVYIYVYEMYWPCCVPRITKAQTSTCLMQSV